MKFDVSIGNPPYARGMDIDFVFKAYELTTNKGLVCMITPGKWQAAEENQIIQSEHSYGTFRRVIVPHISQVVYYMECSELFRIRNIDGITYYIAQKNKTYENNCKVVNTLRNQKYFNNEEVRDITNEQSLNNIGNKLNQLLCDTEKFKFDRTERDRKYYVCTNSMMTGGCGWGYTDRENPCGTYNREGMLHVLGTSIIRDSYNYSRDTSERGCESIAFTSDSKEECESFISYINTKLFRFMVLMNVSKLNSILTDHYFRFAPRVPNNKYDHIFTDNEIYEYFNIPEEYITVIEAVIKERT